MVGGVDHLVVGHVTKPHGTRGEVFVWPLTDEVEALYAPGRRLLLGTTGGDLDTNAEPLIVERSRPFKRGVLVKFEALGDRTAVEPLSQRYLLVPIGELAPLAEGEVFYHQLLGLEVVTAEGEVVGRVREVYDTEPAHLLEVRAESGRQHLVPFSERIVRKVDLEARRLVIQPPAGLLEL